MAYSIPESSEFRVEGTPTYTKEKLAELAVRALEMRRQAHELEMEQSKLNKDVPEADSRHRSLGLRARMLRTDADRIYAPVLEAAKEDLKEDLS